MKNNNAVQRVSKKQNFKSKKFQYFTTILFIQKYLFTIIIIITANTINNAITTDNSNNNNILQY